jgi:hypothetical protein
MSTIANTVANNNLLGWGRVSSTSCQLLWLEAKCLWSGTGPRSGFAANTRSGQACDSACPGCAFATVGQAPQPPRGGDMGARGGRGQGEPGGAAPRATCRAGICGGDDGGGSASRKVSSQPGAWERPLRGLGSGMGARSRDVRPLWGRGLSHVRYRPSVHRPGPRLAARRRWSRPRAGPQGGRASSDSTGLVPARCDSYPPYPCGANAGCQAGVLISVCTCKG